MKKKQESRKKKPGRETGSKRHTKKAGRTQALDTQQKSHALQP